MSDREPDRKAPAEQDERRRLDHELAESERRHSFPVGNEHVRKERRRRERKFSGWEAGGE